jgi:hypothetical protein
MIAKALIFSNSGQPPSAYVSLMSNGVNNIFDKQLILLAWNGQI